MSPSLSGLEALRFAVAEARRRQARLVAVRAWSYNGGGTRSRPMWEWDRALSDTARRTVVDAFHAAVGDLPADLDVVVRAVEGAAAVTLLDSVGSADDLLVIGAGRRWPAGGVVRACTRGAACPVVVVPRPELARAGGRMAARRMLREAEASLEQR